jgi:hypothetical protein
MAVLKRIFVATAALSALTGAAIAQDGCRVDPLQLAEIRALGGDALVEYWQRCADLGNALAQSNLAFMYRNGDGVPQDYVEAVSWYRLAAEQGVATAQSNLGYMYRNGYGVPPDDVLAYMWFTIAAANGHAEATKRRGALVVTGEQIAAADRLAREWLEAHPN